MHLFLYKASRHEKPKTYYGGRRLVQGSYRNDFDLELIKGGIKGRYTILPHGSNAFQARLTDFGLEEEFYGHIIEVPEARNAIWFKLNYDNIGKPGTVYQGSWKSLDVNELTQYDEPFQELKKKKKLTEMELQQVKYHGGTVGHFISSRHNYSGHLDEVKEIGASYHKAILKAEQELSEELRLIYNEMEDIRKKIRTYMKSQEL